MRALLRRLFAARRAVVVYVLLILLGWVAGKFLVAIALPDMRPLNEPMIHRIVLAALALFVVAAAIPFVPGAEIGFALLLLFGAKAAPIVYAGMVSALLLSYGIARLVPLHLIARLTIWLGLVQASKFLGEIAALRASERRDIVAGRIQGGMGAVAFRNRYALLAMVLNVPGNSVLGGGGGLAFMAGLSHLYSFFPYAFSVLIAVAPIPLGFYLFAI